MKHTTMVAMLAVALASSAGCGDEAAADPSPEKLIQQWSAAGLKTTAFKELQKHKLDGGVCTRGNVGGIETTLCRYERAAKASAAQGGGLSTVGARTGAVLAEGRLLLIVVDRKKKDKTGRVINKITKVFRGRAVDGT